MTQTESINKVQNNSENRTIITNPDADLHTLVGQIRGAEGQNVAVIDARDTSQSVNWIKHLKTDEQGNTIVPGVPVTIVEADKPYAAAVYIVEPGAKPVAKDQKGGVWGDPHFVGLDGKHTHFDFQGHNGGKYVILKDGDFEVNASFNSWSSNATVMTDTVTEMNGHKIEFGLSGPPKIDGKAVSSQNEIDQIFGNGSVKWNGNTLHVVGNNGEYAMDIKRQNGYIDIDVKTGPNGVLADGIAPTGILGQTAVGKFGNNESFEIKDIFANYQEFEKTETGTNRILKF